MLSTFDEDFGLFPHISISHAVEQEVDRVIENVKDMTYTSPDATILHTDPMAALKINMSLFSGWIQFSLGNLLNNLECPDDEHDVSRSAKDHVAEDNQEEDAAATIQLTPTTSSLRRLTKTGK